jgi:hypothetical protein
VKRIYLNISKIKLIFVLKEKITDSMFKANNQPELFTFKSIYLEKAKKYRRFSPQNAVGNFSLNTT